MTQMSHLSNVWFSVTPLQVASGRGCWVTTTDGEEYLDFAAGIAVKGRPGAAGHYSRRGTYGKCLRWMPPLVVNEREIDLALAAFAAALKATA